MLYLPSTIKMIITDFDGIMTDNCIYINDSGEISRKLNFKDIMGVSILHKNGYKIGIISGEKNAAIDLLNKKFNLDEVHQDIRNKKQCFDDIIIKHELSPDEFVYIGDDVNDYDILRNIKYPITVPNAIKKITSIENIQITENKGGEGAFREVVDSVLKKG